MSHLSTKLTSTLRLLRHPSQWKWLERFINKAYFVPIHDCGDFTKFNGPEYWLDPDNGMPRSKMTKTGAFARYFFPEETKRIEELRKRNLATKKALATTEKLASEVRVQGQADAEGEKAKAHEAETMAEADIKESSEGESAARENASVKESDTAGEVGEGGTEAAKKEDENGATLAGAGLAKATS